MSVEILLDPHVAITTLGTCRIADTIAASAKSRPFQVENTNVYGFAHTPKEILQQIDYLEGSKTFPQELARFMSADGLFERGKRGDTNAFIVEISTLKEIIFEGWYLQINYMERALRAARGVFDAFSKLKSERDLSIRRATLRAVPGFPKLSSLDQRVVLEGYVRNGTFEELEADMVEIVRRLPGSVIFVNHINLPGANGTLIESRAQLVKWVQQICERRGYRHFDPTPYVQEYGRDHALADLGRDLNHYTHDFKPVLGNLIVDQAFPGKFPLQNVRVGLTASGADISQTRANASTSSEKRGGTPSSIAEQPGAIELPVACPPDAPTAGEASAVLPERLAAAVSSAKKLIANGDLDEAEAVLHELAVEDHHSALVHTLLGTVSFHRGDTAAAIAQFREAVALDAELLEPRVMLVKGALRMGKLQEACSMAADLVRRAPDDPRILLVASKAMMRAKRYADSSGIWRRISYLQPELVMPHIEIARCELKSRNYDAAIAAANDALCREAREPSALVIKSEALQKLKRMEELAEVSVELASIDPAAAMSAVPALISAHYPEEAAKIVACASRAGEVDIDAVMRAGLIQALERRGKVAEERGSSASAAAAWKAILRVDPENARAALGLRRLWSPLVVKAREAFTAGDFGGATDFYCSALEIQEDNQRIIRELALVDGLERIRYTTSHPADMTDELIEAHGEVDKLMPYLHLPVQSGSNRILKAMNRSHTAED